MNDSQASKKILSIIIPIYNELGTWRELVDRVVSVSLPAVNKQLVFVDDGSTDGTRAQLEEFGKNPAAALSEIWAEPIEVKIIYQAENRGKGAALRTGFSQADGDFIIVQDADLEYDPADYAKLLEPMLAGGIDVVYGSRFSGGRSGGALKNYLANRFLTILSNLTTGLGLTDMETCYKLFDAEFLAGVSLEQDRFGFEPEVTAKIARLGVRICEVPIGYRSRSADEGKKIGFRDGLNAIWCIFKYGLFCR